MKVSFVAGASVVVISASAIAQDSINWPAGATFTYAQLDAWKKETGRWVTRVENSTEDGYSVIEVNSGEEVRLKVTRSGVYSRPKPGTDGVFEYTPVKLPLSKGSTWEWTYHYIGKNTGALGVTTRKCEAESQEEVEVPAGKFLAWRIGCRGGWQSMAGSSGSNSRTMWYAPELSALVKWDERTSYFGGSDRVIVTLESVQGIPKR